MLRHAQQGNSIARKKDRDAYTKLSYSTAKMTAKRLDYLFTDFDLLVLYLYVTKFRICKARPRIGHLFSRPSSWYHGKGENLAIWGKPVRIFKVIVIVKILVIKSLEIIAC